MQRKCKEYVPHVRFERQILQFEKDLVGFVHDDGYDQRTNEERWTFPAALMFTLGMISMIGYGDIVPRSEPGKIATLAYATFGIPVYVLYFMSMGKVFANVLKWVYTKAYRYGWLGEGGRIGSLI